MSARMGDRARFTVSADDHRALEVEVIRVADRFAAGRPYVFVMHAEPQVTVYGDNNPTSWIADVEMEISLQALRGGATAESVTVTRLTDGADRDRGERADA